MTSRLEITPEAERDILGIAFDIKQHRNIAAARHALNEIRTQLNSLPETPDSGRTGGCDGTREVIMSGLPYIAVFEQTDATVTILRILYGADERRQSKRVQGKKI